MAKIPNLKSEEEIQKFWAVHDSADYFDDMVDDKVKVDFISGEGVLILPLERKYLQETREIALKRGISSNLLLKSWIVSALKKEVGVGA